VLIVSEDVCELHGVGSALDFDSKDLHFLIPLRLRLRVSHFQQKEYRLPTSASKARLQRIPKRIQKKKPLRKV
jgi:hypothetical protein